MPQEIYQHTFANGLTLLAERMEHVRSAALNFLVPAGSIYDPPKQLGLTSVLCELITRGAGARDSRQLTEALDSLGLDRSESVGAYHTRFWASTLADNLPAALEIYADILRRPRLPKKELDPVKALALQDLEALEDEPRQKVMIELRRRHYAHPLGQDRRGTAEGIAAIDHASLQAHFARSFQPQETILSIAGNIHWESLLAKVGELFGDWQAQAPPPLKLRKPRGGREHLAKDTAQTQIALAYPSVPFGHADYYVAQGAVQVLSGGMSCRLFTEVREKRGLCYAVWATYQTFRDSAAILCYAGTTNERAQETLTVLLHELHRLQDGVTDDEIERVQAGLKSGLIMQEESTSARAGALASDWFYLQRIRSADEIRAAIDAFTPRRIADYARRYPPVQPTLVTLGPKPLRLQRKRLATID